MGEHKRANQPPELLRRKSLARAESSAFPPALLKLPALLDVLRCARELAASPQPLPFCFVLGLVLPPAAARVPFAASCICSPICSIPRALGLSCLPPWPKPQLPDAGHWRKSGWECLIPPLTWGGNPGLFPRCCFERGWTSPCHQNIVPCADKHWDEPKPLREGEFPPSLPLELPQELLSSGWVLWRAQR